jgi:Recombination directionality factor-like
LPIVDLQRRLHEAGRIRIGVSVPTAGGKTRPQRLTTFRITSQDRRALDRAASAYGGTVEAWRDAPVGEQWQVITTTSEIRVAVPPERMALSQSYELWSGGGCVRRCDGERQANDEPCLCASLDADDQTPRCSRHTRVSLMLADLATTGLWRLDTQGFYASEELAGAFEVAQMLARATGQSLLPGWLRLEQREIRRPGEQVKRFAVPVLDLEMDAAVLLGPSRLARPMLPAANGEPAAGLTPVPAETPPSLADELVRVTDTEPKPRRRNAAAPIPATGLRPRTAAQARTAEPITKPQLRKLQAGFREIGMMNRKERLDFCSGALGHDLASANDLTIDEASRLIEMLEAIKTANAAAGPESAGDTEEPAAAHETPATPTGETGQAGDAAPGGESAPHEDAPDAAQTPAINTMRISHALYDLTADDFERLSRAVRKDGGKLDVAGLAERYGVAAYDLERLTETLLAAEFEAWMRSEEPGQQERLV